MFLVTSLLLTFAVLLLTGPLAVEVYLRISRALRPLFWVLWGILLLAAGIFSAYHFTSFFPGPGCFLSAASIPMVALTYLWARRRWGQRVGDDPDRQHLPRALLVISLMQVSILFVMMGFTGLCNAANRRAAQPVIAALDAYRADRGAYPSALDDLIPAYLPAPPQTACALPAALRWEAWYTLEGEYAPNWRLYDCGDGEIRLLVPYLGSQTRQVYNPATGEWGLGDAFDGYCY